MASDSRKTHALKLPEAMPVRTLVIEVKEGPESGTRWEGEQGSVGSASDNAFVLSDDTVSRYHVRLAALPEGVRVQDLGSTNGTFAGAMRIDAGTVPHGTVLGIGRSSIVVGKGLPATVPLHDEGFFGGLRGETPAMRRLMSQVQRAARSNIATLLVGESGTGKELIARALHDASPRAGGPFVTVDCGSVTSTLVASELFGHEKGAFTGATHTKTGAFEAAHGGTLFLDEIGELPADLQPVLLGALERRRFCRVGGRKEIAVDVRVVSATHRDLRADVNTGLFRLDLYYRLAVVTLEVPPLRERANDIGLLIAHFMREEGVERPISELVPAETLTRWLNYPWPGNVRELKNCVLATLAMGEPAQLVDMRAEGVPGDKNASFEPLLNQAYGEARSRLLEAFERHYLQRLMERAQGNVAHAARNAQMARSHLNELLRRHRMR